MQTLFAEPKNLNEARTQTNIVSRAEILFADGYTAYQTATAGVWGVYSPEGKSYTVNLNKATCDCLCFTERRDCKHRIGLVLQLKREADEAEKWEAICAEHTNEFEDMFEAACRKAGL